jgi:uncharacterized protein
MAKLSQTEKIIEILKLKPGNQLSARQIAEKLITKYPDDYKEKRKNPRFENDKAFVNQVVAEIGSQKNLLRDKSPSIKWKDKPRPRVYWYAIEEEEKKASQKEIEVEALEKAQEESLKEDSRKEQELYPILIEYLIAEYNLLCLRINEKKSTNSRGPGGNQWLHPDIVAMQAKDKEWNQIVKECASSSSGQSVRLWSFEVKRKLNSGNIRKCFFQAVSNSSWANEGYLVAAEVDASVEQELRMLSALHGIGVILLDAENPPESEILLPAKSREEVDWESVNRIAVENKDFMSYVESISTYFKTGRIKEKDWDNSLSLSQP